MNETKLCTRRKFTVLDLMNLASQENCAHLSSFVTFNEVINESSPSSVDPNVLESYNPYPNALLRISDTAFIDLP